MKEWKNSLTLATKTKKLITEDLLGHSSKDPPGTVGAHLNQMWLVWLRRCCLLIVSIINTPIICPINQSGTTFCVNQAVTLPDFWKPKHRESKNYEICLNRLSEQIISLQLPDELSVRHFGPRRTFKQPPGLRWKQRRSHILEHHRLLRSSLALHSSSTWNLIALKQQALPA